MSETWTWRQFLFEEPDTAKRISRQMMAAMLILSAIANTYVVVSAVLLLLKA